MWLDGDGDLGGVMQKCCRVRRHWRGWDWSCGGECPGMPLGLMRVMHIPGESLRTAGERAVCWGSGDGEEFLEID